MSEHLPIILASNSASRKAMLEASGVPFEARGADIDERALEAEMEGADPAEIAQALAAAKAVSVSRQDCHRLVLGSDSLVEIDGQRFDKPESREQAAEHLRYFSGRVMRLHSAAALAVDGRITWIDHGLASLHVRELSDAFIELYLDAEWPHVSYCAGAFRIEAMGPQLFEAIIGDQFTVLGMPLLQVLGALRARGVLVA